MTAKKLIPPVKAVPPPTPEPSFVEEAGLWFEANKIIAIILFAAGLVLGLVVGLWLP